MAQTYNKLKIDIKEQVTDIITAKQNDSNSRFLDVYLYDGGIPIDLTGHEVRIYMLKADGAEIFNNGEITDATAGRCQFELTDQALGAYGKLLCEITIWKDNVQILTSQTFDIHVVKSLRTNGSIESSNEYGALVVLYQNLYEAIDLMTTMVEQFGEPGEVADAASIATFWQMLEYLYGVNETALKNASVSEVLERIGLNTDGEDTGTLFGAVNPLNELVSEKSDDIMNKLNEQSEAIEGCNNTVQYFAIYEATKKTSLTNVFSVNGSGTLEYLALEYHNKNSTLTLRLTIDDEIVLYCQLKMTSTSSGKNTGIYLINPLYTISMNGYEGILGTSNFNLAYNINPGYDDFVSSNYTLPLNLTSSLQSKSYSDTLHAFAILKKGLSFSKNLKVEILNTGTDSQYLDLLVGYMINQ